MRKVPEQLNIKSLLSEGNYIVPIYQRNYAWRNSEITQLIQDIVDYIKKDKTQIKDKPNYYLGTLIVYERNDGGRTVFETIDGQQRLTTLTILLSVINNEYRKIDWFKGLNLQFDSRKVSTQTLQYLFKGVSLEDKDCNVEIKQGYEDVKKALKEILIEFDLSLDIFCDYLFEKVIILRVLVPYDTDLNHYFEIMNSRGEQLEKHEILKAKCLEILDEKDRYAFNLIWEACSNMEKYVQYEFNLNQRNVVFGGDDNDVNKWNNLISLDELYSELGLNLKLEYQSGQDHCKNHLTIDELLSSEIKWSSEQSQKKENESERFNSVINFSNFLLHILRIQEGKDIALDDKRLIELFNPYLKDKDSNKDFVKSFGYNLLKGKFLFDKYIIKREFAKGTDSWSLKKLKWYEKNNANYLNTFGNEESNDGENREILMLLSMFHVSNPTLVYKHWLNAALKYVFENESTNASDYKKYLEELAKAFLFDRLLANDTTKDLRKERIDYFEIIYTNKGKSKNTIIYEKNFNQGTSVENFIFNYLDYLLWQDYRGDTKKYFRVEKRQEPFYDDRINKFEYTFRSSVEHYYPQHPIATDPNFNSDWLNHFGNLCLISISKNSQLGRSMPIAKKEHYQKSLTIDSIKQRIMMEYVFWDTEGDNKENEIEEHGNKMIELLLKQ